jgi:hypothetical protein
MMIMFIIYLLVGIGFGVFQNLLYERHIEDCHNQTSDNCHFCHGWRGFLFQISIFMASVIWPITLIPTIILRNSLKPVTKLITSGDAAAAMLHKTLRHLVRACDVHNTACQNKEEVLNAMLIFSKEALSTELNNVGVQRMANLEERAMALKVTTTALMCTMYEVYKMLMTHKTSVCQMSFGGLMQEIEPFIGSYCFCDTGYVPCRRHEKGQNDAESNS